MQTWQSFDQFRGEAKFSTWVYQVALNTAISGIRKKRRSITIMPQEVMSDMADHSPPDDEQLQMLHKAIRQLNGIEKALTLLYLEDRSYREMEAILGISEATLRVKMNRVKEKLRKLTKA